MNQKEVKAALRKLKLEAYQLSNRHHMIGSAARIEDCIRQIMEALDLKDINNSKEEDL
jgi:hypothetical protein